jgi:diguanylate cyclase (GGDEF)-like protein
MPIDKKMLEIVSNETKNSIDRLSVVTPSIYASIFNEFATQHKQNLEDEKALAHDLMKIECENLTQLQEQTSKSVHFLSDNTSKAIDAIKEKDDSILGSILKETLALKDEIEKLKNSVYKDELTQIYNRKWLHDHFLQKETETFNKVGTLAIIDLNYFKQINDTHGHIIGDKVLIFIANQIKKLSAEAVRYGGDEFLLLFDHHTTLTEAKKLLNEMREHIIAKKLKAHETTFRVSFSFGLTSFTTGEELDSVIERADKNMYVDKISIKKRVKGI